MPLRRRTAALLSAPCVALSLLVVAGPASGSPTGPAVTSDAAARAAVPHQVTLITGDVVTYTELPGGRSTAA